MGAGFRNGGDPDVKPFWSEGEISPGDGAGQCAQNVSGMSGGVTWVLHFPFFPQ